jgi:hypothetical protein
MLDLPLPGCLRRGTSQEPNVTEQPQNENACKHSRTRVIAKDNDAQYLECLDCGAILEAGELEKENPAFGESLSDA